MGAAVAGRGLGQRWLGKAQVDQLPGLQEANCQADCYEIGTESSAVVLIRLDVNYR
jgi:hypothetical protein